MVLEQKTECITSVQAAQRSSGYETVVHRGKVEVEVMSVTWTEDYVEGRKNLNPAVAWNKRHGISLGKMSENGFEDTGKLDRRRRLFKKFCFRRTCMRNSGENVRCSSIAF